MGIIYIPHWAKMKDISLTILKEKEEKKKKNRYGLFKIFTILNSSPKPATQKDITVLCTYLYMIANIGLTRDTFTYTHAYIFVSAF